MAAKPTFSKEQLNFFKFSTLVLDEFPNVLRQIFITMWDSKVAIRSGFIAWDDSTLARNMLLASEGGKTIIPITKSIKEWDCTALLKATIFAKTFGVPSSKGSTLHDLYLKNIKPAPGSFHPSVQSSTGNQDETYALAIDQLRLLRNTLCHSPKSEIVKSDFDNYVQLVNDALTSMNVNTAFVGVIGKMSEDDFPTEKVQKLHECLLKELQAISMFHENVEQKLSSIDERTGEIHERTGEIHERTGEIHERTGEIHERTDEIHERTGEIHQRTGEIHQRTKEIHQRTEESHERTGEIHQRTKKIYERTEEVYTMVKNLGGKGNVAGVIANIQENNGNVFVSDHQNVTITCRCAAGGHNHTQAVRETSCNNATEGAIQPVLPRLQVNDNEINILSDSNVCLCAVYERGNTIVVERPLSKIVTGYIREKNCPHFEVQLKVIPCKICKGRNGETTTYSSQEFECISNIHDLDEDIPLELSRVNCQSESETPFQTFLAKSQKLIKAEGSLIRIDSKVCENGRKVRIKLLFDVRSSVRRRSKSLPDRLLPRNISEKLCSFRHISRSFSYSKSTACLRFTQSAITILDEEVNLQDAETPDSVITTLAATETIVQNPDTEDQVDGFLENTEDSSEGEDQVNRFDELDLDGLRFQDVFATGKFGPLYKVSIEERELLIKIVTMDTESENFLKESRRFSKCRNPYIRPTVDILERKERSYVLYWFLEGHSLFKAIEDNVIPSYVIFCRILFGMVKGLVYLRRMGIQCQFLTPEKVLLDTRFNPRISGVGLAYFQSSKHTETSHGEFHRSLSYLDCYLRSSEEDHPKNVLWSVGRCIWDMLLGRICQTREQGDLLSTYGIIEHLNESCDNQRIKSAYFSPDLRKIVFGAGWPKDKEITKSLVVCAVRCMLVDLEERMSLDDLHGTLEAELCELQKRAKEKFSLYENSNNLCLYCIENERDNLALTCGCSTACCDCLRNHGQLDCPEHGMQYSKIGHPLTYGVIIQGEYSEDQSVCENDSDAIESLLNDQDIFAIKNFERVKPKSQDEANELLKKVKAKIMGDCKKARESVKYPTTLLLYITGHCNDSGSLILPDSKILKKKSLREFVNAINPKNLIVLANGFYSEKLVKSLASSKFFGVFSHGGNLCAISHEDISNENSILARFILDIFKKDQSEAPPSLNGVAKRYLTAAGLADEISKRMQEKFSKSLGRIDRDGGRVPIAYI